MRRALRDRALEGSLEHLELLAAAHHRRVEVTFVSCDVREDGDQTVGGHWLFLALEVERGDRLHLDRVLHQPMGRLAEEDLAGRGGLLQTGGDVHRVPRNQTLPGRRVTGHHFPGVDTDPSGDPDAVFAFELQVERTQRLPHPGSGADRADRVVLVQPRDPEDGHHGIADELLDRASVAFDHRRHLVEVAAHHAAKGLRIQPLPQGRGPRDVGEDDRDDPADIGGDAVSFAEPSRTVLAEASLIGVFLAAGRAQLHERILDGALPAPERSRALSRRADTFDVVLRSGLLAGRRIVRRRDVSHRDPERFAV